MMGLEVKYEIYPRKVRLVRLLWAAVISMGLSPSCVQAQQNLPPEWRGLLLQLYADSVLAIKVTIQLDDGSNITKEGTAFIVDPSGFALTAAHLMGPMNAKRQIEMRARDRVNGRPWAAEVIKIDQDLDVALVKLPDPFIAHISWIPVQLGNSTGLSPLNSPQLTVLAFNKVHESLDTYQGTISTAELKNGWFSLRGDPLEPGNSGGPVFNTSVQVVGWVVGGRPASPGSPPQASYISPINFARGVLAVAGLR